MANPFNLDTSELDDDDVRKPNIPMAVYHQEANDLLVFLAKDDGWQRLHGVGLDPSAQGAAEQALTASRAAQSRGLFRVVHGKRKSTARANCVPLNCGLRRFPRAATIFVATAVSKGHSTGSRRGLVWPTWPLTA